MIVIQTIDHQDQRYDTCGDWYYDDNGHLVISVSKLGNWRYEMMVAVHELVECLIAKELGIPQAKVDAFDVEYEKNRQEGDISEPGDDINCPVYFPHQLATSVERMLGAAFSVDWRKYEQTILKLPKVESKIGAVSR